MPIYAYRCESCGFQKDVLRKMSDPPLTDCPSCGKSTFQKQVTAAGFQLKGSGWYVTDFRDNGNKGASSTTTPSSGSDGAGTSSGGNAESGSGASGGEAKPAAPAAAPAAASTPATPAAPAGGGSNAS